MQLNVCSGPCAPVCRAQWQPFGLAEHSLFSFNSFATATASATNAETEITGTETGHSDTHTVDLVDVDIANDAAVEDTVAHEPENENEQLLRNAMQNSKSREPSATYQGRSQLPQSLSTHL